MNAPQNHRLEQWAEAERWLAYADGDLEAVDALLKLSSQSSLQLAAFHCQQAVEKMAKAILISLGAELVRVHDIERLAELIAAVDESFGKRILKQAKLSTWYFWSRYPDASDELGPSRQDVHAVLSELRVLRRDVQSLAPEP